MYYWNSITEVSTYDKPPCLYDQEWQKIEDENGTYYWNVWTNDTQYDVPESFREVEAGGEGGSYITAAATTETETETTVTEATPTSPSPPAPAGSKMWSETLDSSSGLVVFQCSETGEVVASQPPGATFVAFPDGTMWQQYSEETTGRTLYRNAATDETREERPEGGAIVVVTEDGDGEGL